MEQKITKAKKILVVILPEATQKTEKLKGYYTPKVTKNPTQIAEHYKDIPIKYETLVFNSGIIEHTFSIYKDYTLDNVYYLFQNHPLSFTPTTEVFENPNVGLYYNTQKIISNYLYSIVEQVIKTIKEEKFDTVHIYRFMMIPEQGNFFKFVVTPDLLGEIPKRIGFFQGEPVTAQLQIKPSTTSLNLLLFSMINFSKAFIEFYFSYLNIFRYYNGYPVKTMNPDDFLDKVFENIRKTYMPEPLLQFQDSKASQEEQTPYNNNTLNESTIL